MNRFLFSFWALFTLLLGSETFSVETVSPYLAEVKKGHIAVGVGKPVPITDIKPNRVYVRTIALNKRVTGIALRKGALPEAAYLDTLQFPSGDRVKSTRDKTIGDVTLFSFPIGYRSILTARFFGVTDPRYAKRRLQYVLQEQATGSILDAGTLLRMTESQRQKKFEEIRSRMKDPTRPPVMSAWLPLPEQSSHGLMRLLAHAGSGGLLAWVGKEERWKLLPRLVNHPLGGWSHFDALPLEKQVYQILNPKTLKWETHITAPFENRAAKRALVPIAPGTVVTGDFFRLANKKEQKQLYEFKGDKKGQPLSLSVWKPTDRKQARIFSVNADTSFEINSKTGKWEGYYNGNNYVPIAPALLDYYVQLMQLADEVRRYQMKASQSPKLKPKFAGDREALDVLGLAYYGSLSRLEATLHDAIEKIRVSHR